MDVWEKMVHSMAHLDWLMPFASQRMKQGLIHMTTLFPLFFLSLSQSAFLFSSLPACLSDMPPPSRFKVEALMLTFSAHILCKVTLRAGIH